MTSSRRASVLLRIALGGVALGASTACATVSPPFDKMKDSAMTVYRLQNFEAPEAAPAQPAATGFQLPAPIQQWIQAGASMLPAGLLSGLLPGSPAAPPPAADAPRFHGFRILEWQPVNDAAVKNDIVDLFGHASNFQSPTSTSMFAEFGFAMAQPNAPATPADVLVSLSCEATEAFNFTWPYTQTGITPDASKKIASIAQRVFQGH